MMQQTLKNTAKLFRSIKIYIPVVLLTVLLAGCSQLERPKVEPFFAVTVPPPKQELRWSNGKMPKSLDPARAAAAPETDVVRAIYEGLTDLDSKSLREVPGVAKNWESSRDQRVWTFHLRKDARWSNGERVTAADFVRSWKRLGGLGERAANSYLFQNIAGIKAKGAPAEKPSGEPNDFLHSPQSETVPQTDISHETVNLPGSQSTAPKMPDPDKQADPKAETPKFGVEAIDELTLKVTLVEPDKDFPKLVSNPGFLPIYGDGSNFEQARLDQAMVTSGAFRIAKIDESGITLERSDNYWNKRSVTLESVRFVTANTAEAALDAYKKGEVDVVTNAAFEPLALKLLSPYEDFRQTAHSALNYYEFNTAKPPFNDRRVREALTIAIDRGKLTEGDLEGTTQPANKFLLLGEPGDEALSFDAEKARKLLEKAGYAGGSGISPIRLVVNRNDTQQRVARSVARMWKQNLNLDTEIVVKDATEINAARAAGEFDVVRRGVVLPTVDEAVSLTAIFGSRKKPEALSAVSQTEPGKLLPAATPARKAVGKEPSDDPFLATDENTTLAPPLDTTFTEQDAVYELYAMPLYFPTSYSLIKPYVRGFEINGLDAPSLKAVSIDSNWQPKTARGES